MRTLKVIFWQIKWGIWLLFILSAHKEKASLRTVAQRHYFQVLVWRINIKKKLFMLRERERAKERESLKQILCCQHRAWHGALFHEPWPEPKSRVTLNWVNHPGAPAFLGLKKKFSALYKIVNAFRHDYPWETVL